MYQRRKYVSNAVEQLLQQDLLPQDLFWYIILLNFCLV